VVGIEPSQRAAEYARQHTSATILQGRFSEVELAPESIDAIVLWTVLEHLDRPVQDLRYAHALLKKDGWLFFSIPNFESLEARLFRQYWSGWDLPRHLYVFPRPTLHKILETIGFRVAYERCLSTSYAALGHSINFWSQSWEHKKPRLKRLLMRFYYAWPTRVALLAPLAILDRLNLTSTITYGTQKC
jgi:SAM-dependent methyltransferase